MFFFFPKLKQTICYISGQIVHQRQTSGLIVFFSGRIAGSRDGILHFIISEPVTAFYFKSMLPSCLPLHYFPQKFNYSSYCQILASALTSTFLLSNSHNTFTIKIKIDTLMVSRKVIVCKYGPYSLESQVDVNIENYLTYILNSNWFSYSQTAYRFKLFSFSILTFMFQIHLHVPDHIRPDLDEFFDSLTFFCKKNLINEWDKKFSLCILRNLIWP